MDALEMISRELKFYKQTAPNGFAIFCGNVSENEGQPDLKLWIIEPQTDLCFPYGLNIAKSSSESYYPFRVVLM